LTDDSDSGAAPVKATKTRKTTRRTRKATRARKVPSAAARAPDAGAAQADSAATPASAAEPAAVKPVGKTAKASKTVKTVKATRATKVTKATKAPTRKTGDGSKLPKDSPPRKRYDPKRTRRVPVRVRLRTLDYEAELLQLQIELLKLQAHVKSQGMRILMLFEGRDAAGKGGTIKRITEHLNPRGARVVALEKPSDRETTQWYFQRYVAHLPAAGEIVLFDRSWYNRAMVEPVMGFCTDEEHKRFMKDVPLFEQMLVKDGVKLFKFYFSVSKGEQLRRFTARKSDALKQYKISPVDQHAQRLWDAYTVKKFQMLTETNRTIAPWWIIRSDDKKHARLNCIRLILGQVEYIGKPRGADTFVTDPAVVHSGIDALKEMEESLLGDGDLPG
jgi:polyphosphate kinase 2